MSEGINVETTGLTYFSKEVHADTDVFLGPATDRAEVQFRDGVLFGQTNASDVVLAAKERYALSLAATNDNLRQYVAAARLLANAAQKAAEAFDASDTRAADSAVPAQQALFAAAEEARAARMAADRADNPPLGGRTPVAS